MGGGRTAGKFGQRSNTISINYDDYFNKTKFEEFDHQHRSLFRISYMMSSSSQCYTHHYNHHEDALMDNYEGQHQHHNHHQQQIAVQYGSHSGGYEGGKDFIMKIPRCKSHPLQLLSPDEQNQLPPPQVDSYYSGSDQKDQMVRSE